MSASPPRVVFLDAETLPPTVALRRPGFAHVWVSHAHTMPSETAARIADADIVVTNKVPLTRAMLEGARRLRVVAVAATGTDRIDHSACQALGIVVTNIRNYAVHAVPEHTFALILALSRSLVAYRQSVRMGRWEEAGQFCFFDHPIRDLSGATLGIIGGGALGRAVGDLGRAFGMRVLFSGRKGEEEADSGRTPFAEVLRQSDVITLHCPLTPATRDLIGAAELAAMDRRPLLINTARGGLIDEAALYQALVEGRISGAGIDVATVEPPPAGHVALRLAELPNVIVTPHVAWASREATQSLADQLIDNIEAAWAGTPRNVVVG